MALILCGSVLQVEEKTSQKGNSFRVARVLVNGTQEPFVARVFDVSGESPGQFRVGGDVEIPVSAKAYQNRQGLGVDFSYSGKGEV